MATIWYGARNATKKEMLLNYAETAVHQFAAIYAF